MPRQKTPHRYTYLRYFTLLIVVSFIIEATTMYVLGIFLPKHPIWATFIDAFVVSLTLAVGLYFWILPRLKLINREMQDQAALQNTLTNAIPAPIFYKDKDGVYTGCNEQFETYLGLSRDQIVGRTVHDIASPSDANVYHKADMDLIQKGGNQVYEASVSHADGTRHDVMFHKAVFRKSNDEVGGIIGIMLDITARKDLERKLLTLASLDDLTGLSNRREFDNRLVQALARNARAPEPQLLALLFIDMDGFKDVNDKHGHDSGDQVLKTVAERITSLLRKSDIAGRMGGDEFAVILEGTMTRDTTSLVADKLLRALAEPYHLGDGNVARLSASIGIAFSPTNGNTLKDLLSKADGAMYEAKNLGKNRYIMAGGA